jgi:hypothetical protein
MLQWTNPGGRGQEDEVVDKKKSLATMFRDKYGKFVCGNKNWGIAFSVG